MLYGVNVLLMYVNSTDIELGEDLGPNGLQTVGLRFQGVNVPQGATIDTAYLTFVVDETNSATAFAEIHAHASDNAPAFTASDFNVTDRPLTAAGAPVENDSSEVLRIVASG